MFIDAGFTAAPSTGPILIGPVDADGGQMPHLCGILFRRLHQQVDGRRETQLVAATRAAIAAELSRQHEVLADNSGRPAARYRRHLAESSFTAA